MSQKQEGESEKQWVCGKCGAQLEKAPVNISYLGAGFPVDLWQCKKCKRPLITPDMAMGKMLEAEKVLEDK